LTSLFVYAAVASTETTTAVLRTSLFTRVGNGRDYPAATKVSTTPLTSLRPTAFSASFKEELAVILSVPRTSLFFLGALHLCVCFVCSLGLVKFDLYNVAEEGKLRAGDCIGIKDVAPRHRHM
jgi:hypothetical protein